MSLSLFLSFFLFRFSRFLSRVSEQTDRSRLGSSLRGSSQHRAGFIKGVIFYENTR
jgi:hypothetical protein